MTPPDLPVPVNSLVSRIAVLEYGQESLREELRELRSRDLAEIKDEVKALRSDLTAGGRGMSRAEKFSAAALGIMVIMATLAALTFVLQAAA